MRGGGGNVVRNKRFLNGLKWADWVAHRAEGHSDPLGGCGSPSLPLPVPPTLLPPHRPLDPSACWLMDSISRRTLDTQTSPLSAPAPESVQTTLSLSLSYTHTYAEDERSRGGKQWLLSFSPAAQHLTHRLCGPLGRSIARPGGQSPESPGAGPVAAGREEEVLLHAQTRRHAGQLNRWDDKQSNN